LANGVAHADANPRNAVFFGETDGDEYPTAIALDEFGFVYVAGTTTSPTLGVHTGDRGMLYVKTHWDLNVELNIGETNVGFSPPQAVSIAYLRKRFITPKKFRNIMDNGVNSGIVFNSVLTLLSASYVFPT
jgi:hypothetical protein